MATKHGRMVTYLEQLLPIKLGGLARSRDKVKSLFHNHNTYDYQTWQGWDCKEKLPSKKSQGSLITWSWNVT